MTDVVKSELWSSSVEKSLKNFIAVSCLHQYEGEKADPENATTPFDFTQIPANSGEASFTLDNQTRYEFILFYFDDQNVLAKEDARPYSCLIRPGKSFSFNIIPNFGRLNVAFGSGWIRLNEPLRFFYTQEGNATGSWQLNEFFQRPVPSQPYLKQDLIIYDFPLRHMDRTDPTGPHALFLPDKESTRKREKIISITIREASQGLQVRVKGNLYLYLNPPNYPGDFPGSGVN